MKALRFYLVSCGFIPDIAVLTKDQLMNTKNR